jgi:hypothetical protein
MAPSAKYFSSSGVNPLFVVKTSANLPLDKTSESMPNLLLSVSALNLDATTPIDPVTVNSSATISSHAMAM